MSVSGEPTFVPVAKENKVVMFCIYFFNYSS